MYYLVHVLETDSYVKVKTQKGSVVIIPEDKYENLLIMAMKNQK